MQHQAAAKCVLAATNTSRRLPIKSRRLAHQNVLDHISRPCAELLRIPRTVGQGAGLRMVSRTAATNAPRLSTPAQTNSDTETHTPKHTHRHTHHTHTLTHTHTRTHSHTQTHTYPNTDYTLHTRTLTHTHTHTHLPELRLHPYQ